MIDSMLRAYQSPTRMAHGVGALRSLGDEARALGMTRPLQTAGGVHDVPHGALTARLLAPVMEYNYAGEPERFARIAQALGVDGRGRSVWDAAESAAVAAVYQLAEDVEIPSLQELGFTEEEIPMLAEKAAADSQTIGNPRDVDRAGYERIYRRAFETARKRD